jgi:purine-nucleoside/S-methyl-5'-thioadenosine phosphorylase / adenosine deaminase
MIDSTAPSLADRFRGDGLDWIIPEWDAHASVRAFATTRNGGASRGPYATMNLGRATADDESALAANRARLDAYLPASPVWLQQVHGTTVTILAGIAPSTPPVADAAVTREPGIVCAVLTADCVPVLLASRTGRAVGVAHAGWRGLAGGILESTLGALRALDAPPADVVAWLGPAIEPASFEVGADVVAAFCEPHPGDAQYFAPRPNGKWLADLPGLARRRLQAAGVAAVTGGGWCTYADHERFFSYRRNRTSGRMAAVVWIAPAGV